MLIRKRMKRLILLAMVAGFLSPGVSILQAAGKPAAEPCCGQCPTEGMTCAAFAQKIAMVDMLEIKLGKVAEVNSPSLDVQKFGAYMVESHTEINEWLTKVAAECSITIPTTLDAPSKATLKKLSALRGEAFDQAYIPAMVAGHTQVLAMVKSFAKTCPKGPLKAFAKKITPIIAKHLKDAKKVEDRLQKKGKLAAS